MISSETAAPQVFTVNVLARATTYSHAIRSISYRMRCNAHPAKAFSATLGND